MFILMFISPAIVPVATMPGWLQPVARNQPFSVTVNAVRALLEGGPVYHHDDRDHPDAGRALPAWRRVPPALRRPIHRLAGSAHRRPTRCWRPTR